jgi:hypothetical protein
MVLTTFSSARRINIVICSEPDKLSPITLPSRRVDQLRRPTGSEKSDV